MESTEEQQQLLTFCKAQGIQNLFLQIPYEAEKEQEKWEIQWNPSGLRPFLARLHQSGVKVHALDGDPRFVLTEWHGRVFALTQKIIEYNQSVSVDQRFDGIRYDNEPYLLPQFPGVHRGEILKQYLSLLSATQAMAEALNQRRKR